MNDEADIAELQAMNEINIFEGIFDYLFLEGIGMLFTIAAIILIIVSSIKLLRSVKIPGSKLIFSSIILTILGAIISVLIEYYAVSENIYLYDATINMFLGGVFFMGSYGFLRVCNFITNNYANK